LGEAVRLLSVFLIFLLAGCGSMESMVANPMLQTAPQNNSELLHPDWGETPRELASQSAPQQRSMRQVQGPYGETKSQELNTLLRFLSQQGIEHEVVPGGHLMIKLKEKIKFKTGSAYVSKTSRMWLSRLSGYLSSQRNVDIVIDGHTDSQGAKSFNDKLSERRAMEVKAELMRNRVASGAIYTRGYGENMPECSNNSVAGKACNRRVELTFIVTTN